MQFDIWGANSSPYLNLPERTVGFILLILYGLIFIVVLIRHRRDLAAQSVRQWFGLVGLVALSILFSQLFLISISAEGQLPPLSIARSSSAYLAPLLFVPFLLAGVALNPGAAAVVGFSAGLGQGLWQTHQWTDPFQFAWAAILASYLMQQNYNGRLYRLFRQPIIASIFAALLLMPLIAFTTFAYADAEASWLSALDLSLSTTTAYLSPLLVEALLGGVIVLLLLIGLPQLGPRRKSVPPPFANSLNARLAVTFAIFAGLLAFVLVVIGFNLALRLATTLAVQQMVRDAEAAAVDIPDFIAFRQNLLVQTGADPRLLTDDPDEIDEALKLLFRSGDFFRSVIFIDGDGDIRAAYPDGGDTNDLTKLEIEAIDDAQASGAPFITSAQETPNDLIFFTIGVPILEGPGDPVGTLLGRLPVITLDRLVTSLQGTLGQGLGFIVDDSGQVIGHPDRETLLSNWDPPASDQLAISTPKESLGFAYEGVNGSTNTRQLVFFQEGPNHPWTIVINLPYEVVLDQALQISGQLALVLLAALILFGGLLLFIGRSITGPLTELVRASQQIADGKLNTAINPRGDDEIGRLGTAFGQMQIALRHRLDELSLLLDVSQDVSRSIDLNQGMPAVLKGALRGTGAAGARVVVLNPSGRQPLTFGEGPACTEMARYDRQIMALIRRQSELILSAPEEIRLILSNGKNPDRTPNSLIALPLATHERFQGVLWLTYSQVHRIDPTELNFLRTLSSQASVLVENARLYAAAEGGRRRLAAVLASTTDAVIVTDQTERILLINPAMEHYFGLKASEIIGHPLRSVLTPKQLVEVLTTETDRVQNAEIPTVDGRVFFTSVAMIYNNEGQAIGRVAVLHDITYLKELDEMKSEFVATVSHDLRSPLTFMLGYATMLPMVGNLEAKQQEYVHKIVTGIEQMSTLIDDLLDLGRLEAGVGLVLSGLRVSELLGSVVEEYRQPAFASGNVLVMEAPNALPGVWGDAALLRQAVANYVSNAIKYAPNSGQITLGATVLDSFVIIRVTDQGPGLSENDQRRVFEKFYRVPQKRGREQVKGSGLGLALVKSIAERHGGRAWCESKVGEGSSFYLALPAHQGEI